ncbi:unnamed protein product [Ectocarpus sp. 12 AP-2014]
MTYDRIMKMSEKDNDRLEANLNVSSGHVLAKFEFDCIHEPDHTVRPCVGSRRGNRETAASPPTQVDTVHFCAVTVIGYFGSSSNSDTTSTMNSGLCALGYTTQNPCRPVGSPCPSAGYRRGHDRFIEGSAG